jgi:hypothetical protein
MFETYPDHMDAERSPFQIHLSTALILLLQVGVLMWLSCPSRSNKIWSPNPRMRDDTVLRQEWGWPVRSWITESPSGPPTPTEYVGGYSNVSVIQFGVIGMTVDFAVGALALGFTLALLERRKQKPQNRHIPWLRIHFLSFVIACVMILPIVIYVDSGGYFDLGEHYRAEFNLLILLIAFELSIRRNITGPKLFSLLNS